METLTSLEVLDMRDNQVPPRLSARPPRRCVAAGSAGGPCADARGCVRRSSPPPCRAGGRRATRLLSSVSRAAPTRPVAGGRPPPLPPRPAPSPVTCAVPATAPPAPQLLSLPDALGALGASLQARIRLPRPAPRPAPRCRLSRPASSSCVIRSAARLVAALFHLHPAPVPPPLPYPWVFLLLPPPPDPARLPPPPPPCLSSFS